MKDHIKKTPVELENAGWLQMKAMLDQHMPVNNIDQRGIVASFKWRHRLPFRQVAVLIPFICISILTGRQGLLEWKPFVQEINLPTREFNGALNKVQRSTFKKALEPLNSSANDLFNDKKIESDISNSGDGPIGFIDANNVSGTRVKISIDRSTLANSGYPTAIDKMASQGNPGSVFPKLVKSLQHTSSPLGIKKETNSNAQPKIKLSAGIGYNVSGARSVYPVVAASYHLNKRNAISIGLEANVPFSPKDVSKREVSFINDTSMNVQFEVNKEKIDKLVYFNVPLEYSFKMKNDISLISGMELSLLQKVHTSKQNEVYDYSSSPARILGPAVMTNVNGLQRLEEKVEPRHTNVKVNAGVAYSRGPVLIQAKYHYNLQEPVLIKDFNGNIKGGNKGTFSIRLLYQL